jgi:putative sterol carrier protein
MTDQDAFDLFEGRLNPQNAFMQGKMKIKGNMQAAMKFTPDLFPKSKLWDDVVWM